MIRLDEQNVLDRRDLEKSSLRFLEKYHAKWYKITKKVCTVQPEKFVLPKQFDIFSIFSQRIQFDLSYPKKWYSLNYAKQMSYISYLRMIGNVMNSKRVM